MLRITIKRPASLPVNNISIFLISAWVLCMIAVPIVYWTEGMAAIYPFINVAVLLQAGAVFAILSAAWGIRRTAIVAGVIIIVTLAAETLGSHTGFPFGSYSYTERLQPQIAHVPLLIPLAWFMMAPSAWAVAHRFRDKTWLFILVSALALTAWDLLLDPQMVYWDLWQWENQGLYFGIPLTNFAGWLLVSALLTWLIRPLELPVRPLLLIYTITWFLEVVGLAFIWGLPGPAIIGGLIMGFFVCLGWKREIKVPVFKKLWASS